MKLFCAALLLAGTACAQNWEVGVMAGGGFDINKPTIKGPSASAEASVGKGPAFGAVLKQDLYDRVSGEIRYLYRRGDLQLSSGSLHASFASESHSLDYEFLIHATGRKAKVRPYLAGGAGFRLFRGTGKETVTQTLGNVALLTKTQEWKPLISVGGGVSFQLSHWVNLALECRDYLTPFPKKVIAPVAGGSPGWLHDLTPLLVLSFRF